MKIYFIFFHYVQVENSKKTDEVTPDDDTYNEPQTTDKKSKFDLNEPEEEEVEEIQQDVEEEAVNEEVEAENEPVEEIKPEPSSRKRKPRKE